MGPLEKKVRAILERWRCPHAPQFIIDDVPLWLKPPFGVVHKSQPKTIEIITKNQCRKYGIGFIIILPLELWLLPKG